MNIHVRVEPGQEDNFFPIWIARGDAYIGLQRESRMISRKSYANMLRHIERVEAKLKKTHKPFNTEGTDEAYERWKADKEMYTGEGSATHLDPNKEDYGY